jgi:hypothetical protein
MYTSALPSLLMPCPQCLIRMRHKQRQVSGGLRHDSYVCEGCGTEVVRSGPAASDAA